MYNIVAIAYFKYQSSHMYKLIKYTRRKTAMIIVLLCFIFFTSNTFAQASAWDYLYGSQLAGVSGDIDSDGDGFTNDEEKLLGTDPLSASSQLNLQLASYTGSSLVGLWKSRNDQQYQLQGNANLTGPWFDIGNELTGTGEELSQVITTTPALKGFYRLKVDCLTAPIPTQLTEVYPYDSDDDGVSDYQEFIQGRSPIENSDEFPALQLLFSMNHILSWDSVEGKRYQIEQKISSVWNELGSSYDGNGNRISQLVASATGNVSEFRIKVIDIDTDSDGVNDWDEIQVGLDPDSPKTDASTKGDGVALIDILDETHSIALDNPKPYANITSSESGEFTLSRVTGSKELTVNYTLIGTAIAGADYQMLSGQVVIPFGVRKVTIPVVPLAGSSLTSARTLKLTLGAGAYTISGSAERQVNIVRENVVNVQDYGAVGNGVADDTVAIQSAITALESDTTLNTLYFPSGTYRLNTLENSQETIYNTKRILKLGISDLANRDIFIKGDNGAVLYSTASPQRAHMLVAMGSFRSLTVTNLVFKQSDVLLSVGESQGSDGISVVRVDLREIQIIKFVDTEFNNCHGSADFYRSAYDARGKLKRLEFLNCKILNPHGSNTEDIQTQWSGGQQVGIGSWVGLARYEGCLFEGGSADMTDHSKAPIGRLKDGGHFGSPLRLEFINNVVRWMAVESMYQLNRGSYIGTTDQGFTIPVADGMTVVTVTVREEDATFVPGQILSVRTETTATVNGRNNIFRVVAFRKALNEVDVVNDGHVSAGHLGNDPPGTILARLKPIYVQEDASAVVEVRGNLLEGKLPPGAEPKNPTGIVSDGTGVIQGNYITGYATGILNYKGATMPLFPGTTGLVIYKNYIRLRHPDLSLTGERSYGVQTHANDIYVGHNVIVCPLSRRTVGIALRGSGANVFDNRVIALNKQVNGYSSSQRSLGIHVGNTSFGTYIYRNTTQNFDVGVGPEPYQSLIHYVEDHTSINDELAIDPRGVVPAP